jgi:uncharacterized protein YbaP (TraB family)
LVSNARGKLTGMEGTIKEVARLLSCGPDSILEVLKEKVTFWQRIEDLNDQKDKDIKRV